MNNVIPAMDPIPLPAPVWLFKLLHILTLALHFVTVEMLLGGLLVAAWLNFLGTRGGPLAGARLTAGAALAKRLPIVMTYVINLGVPPLLFAQVLYGRALYTSSVLIGAWWIAVIFLLMGSYWLLYRFAGRAQAGQAGWMGALLAWLMAGMIAKIYSTNMTLMLRPDVWTSMYSASAHGTLLPPHDPTLLPRWLYMLTGGLAVAGLWMIWLAANRNIAEEARHYLASRGGALGAVGAVALVLLGLWVFRVQPEAVRQGMSTSSLMQGGQWMWVAGLFLALAAGVWSWLGRPMSRWAGTVAAVGGVVCVGGMTLVRDGIRDFSLAAKGFAIQGVDLWQRATHINWGVLILFFVTFIIGLALLGWLISVVLRAKPVTEKVNV
ncbi:hypothetical protein NXS98_01975 [Fontisphaera persica]|uniref:hypothetical protein n=1 Tax=Fontisphaera persica TaxID=2974023 RepID=UPI0024C02CA3|nr:hypothetical protein [Fontisphaera persica]WCJ59914.1 hypothetical protein NXS98_01975 [Fontisphaera persica]